MSQSDRHLGLRTAEKRPGWVVPGGSMSQTGRSSKLLVESLGIVELEALVACYSMGPVAFRLTWICCPGSWKHRTSEGDLTMGNI